MWSGRDGWITLALVLDCCSRELRWRPPHSGPWKTTEAAFEQGHITRFGTPGRSPKSFLLHSDDRLAFTSRSSVVLVPNYGLNQEFITPSSPEQHGMVEGLIRTLKERCVHRHGFETLQRASRVIDERGGFCNARLSHQALGMMTPAEAYALAA